MSMGEDFFKTALLVEDELHLAQTLTIALRKIGISSKHTSTLLAARTAFRQSPPDLIVLDRALPDGDGLELCSEVRKQGYHGTILMLTAQTQTEDKVQGLFAGADDYLGKPFSWEELQARITALARRRFSFSPAQIQPLQGGSLDVWTLDESRLNIKGPRGWVELTPLEYKLATHLMSAGGGIVSRDDLLKKVWGFTLLPKTRTVDHFLGRLRKHFELDPENPRHFITVRGAGYRFER